MESILVAVASRFQESQVLLGVCSEAALAPALGSFMPLFALQVEPLDLRRREVQLQGT